MSTARTRVQRLTGPAAALGVVGVSWAAVAVLRPSDAGPTPCPWRSITGLDCPFCGSTRSAAALAHGDVVTALDHNALFVLAILPLSALAWLLWTRRLWRGEPPLDVPARVVLALVGLTAVWWVVRLAVPWLGSAAAT